MASKYNQAAKQIAAIFRQHELTYDTSRKVVQEARKLLGMEVVTKSRRLPQMPTMEEIARFWQALETGGTMRDIILLKLLYLTGARNSEIRRLKQDAIDLVANRIYISRGKGDKDRYVVFPDSFSLVLRAYLSGLKSHWLFPNLAGTAISARRVQQLIKQYAVVADLQTNMHPHKLRHLLLTHLTEAGMPDAQIQLISGHASRESLKVYQHVGLPGVQAAYEEAMNKKGSK